MSLSLVKADQSKQYIIKNLYPIYLHDMAEIWDIKPNIHGVFEDDDSKTLEDQFKHFEIWWSKEEVFYPFIIYLENIPIGFALVAKAPYCPKESEVCLHEFFILRPYRSKGYGKEAAKKVFDMFSGKWCFYTNPSRRNHSAQVFWRSFLSTYGNGMYQEVEETTGSGSEVLAFRFDVG